jgi:hypothetical protein
MPQRLPHQSQVHIASNQMGRQRVFENMWMAFLHRQSGYQGNGLEHTKELGAVKPAALLACEQVIGTIGWPLPQPTPDGLISLL